MTDFPPLPPIEAIIDLHNELLAEHGGAAGLQNRGALEVALARPRQIMACAEGEEEVTIFDLAASVCVGICRNHPFVDGNKRAGFMALGVILGMNGYFLDVSEREASDTVLAVAASDMTEDTFRDWLARNSFKAD